MNDLDAVGGWQLINDSMFNASMFAQSKMRVENRDKDKDKQDDPDPIQLDRSRFYEELLGVKDRNGNWNARSPGEIRKAKMDLIAKYLAEGRRVMFVRQESPASRQVEVPASGNGFVVKRVERWDAPTVQIAANIANVGKVGGKRRFAVMPQAQGTGRRMRADAVLLPVGDHEDAAPATKPAAATTKPYASAAATQPAADPAASVNKPAKRRNRTEAWGEPIAAGAGKARRLPWRGAG